MDGTIIDYTIICICPGGSCCLHIFATYNRPFSSYRLSGQVRHFTHVILNRPNFRLKPKATWKGVNALKVPDLKDFLQARGVACHLYNKNHLVWLRELATELNLEIIGENREGKPSSADLLTRHMWHESWPGRVPSASRSGNRFYNYSPIWKMMYTPIWLVITSGHTTYIKIGSKANQIHYSPIKLVFPDLDIIMLHAQIWSLARSGYTPISSSGLL